MKRLYHLYHVSFSVRRIEQFTPRIPRQRMTGEDATTRRICLSPGLHACLDANPYPGDIFEDDGYLETHDVTMHRLDHPEKGVVYGVPFVLYAFDVPEDGLLFPADLASCVPDARETGEHWATVPLVPTSTQFFVLYDSNPGGYVDYDELSEDVFRAAIPVDADGAPLGFPFDERPFSVVSDDIDGQLTDTID